MTAINPAKLRIQAAELGELLAEPEQLIPRLHDLFAYYSSHIRQTSLSKIPLRLQSYQTPAPVLQALNAEFKDRLEEDPQAGFRLADTLWREKWVEFRQLAISILGCLPPDNIEEILLRVRNYLKDCTTEDIRRLVMDGGMERVAAESPDRYLVFIQELINSETEADHQAALYGLGYFAGNSDYPNLPALYQKLSQILLAEESGLVREISSLLRVLITRSEQETAYFLAHQLRASPKPRIIRITRQVLGAFSEENQRLLRDELGKHK